MSTVRTKSFFEWLPILLNWIVCYWHLQSILIIYNRLFNIFTLLSNNPFEKTISKFHLSESPLIKWFRCTKTLTALLEQNWKKELSWIVFSLGIFMITNIYLLEEFFSSVLVKMGKEMLFGKKNIILSTSSVLSITWTNKKIFP